ncbi:MAG TPA: nitrate reductase molybdenum cofactor assembly chaperone [Nocardioidaceae bacterium]|jgi:nitrate reductase delta subunit|nr:nitrate reductase molybdenum cofactor assembly chaperone [Nocardioidaceae bacterium]
MRRKHPKSGLAPTQLTAAWQCASLLLGYPDDDLLGRLDVVERAAAALPDAVGRPLREMAATLARDPLPQLQAAYVETFDTRRRCNLYLTYFTHGDTRKRGVALLRFKQAYLRSGFVLDADPASGAELPDHLCVVLEYAATVDQDRGRDLLLDHRAGIELLRLALRDAGSPWAPVLASLCATLPPLRGDEVEAVRRLAAEGPPEEEVGLAPYAMPELAGSADLEAGVPS